MPHKNQNVFTITYKHNLVTHENFVQFCSSIQKLFMIFCYTDVQTDRHTDGQTYRQVVHWVLNRRTGKSRNESNGERIERGKDATEKQISGSEDYEYFFFKRIWF